MLLVVKTSLSLALSSSYSSASKCPFLGLGVFSIENFSKLFDFDFLKETPKSDFPSNDLFIGTEDSSMETQPRLFQQKLSWLSWPHDGAALSFERIPKGAATRQAPV